MDNPDLQQPSKATLDAALALWKQTGRHYPMAMHGSSMRPLLRDGDQIEVIYGTGQLHRGDVIVFKLGEQVVAHRLLKIRRGGDTLRFLAKGDNRLDADLLLDSGQVLGRVLSVTRTGHTLPLDTTAWRTIGWLIARLGEIQVSLLEPNQMAGRKTGGRLLRRPGLLAAKITFRMTLLVVTFFSLCARWRPK